MELTFVEKKAASMHNIIFFLFFFSISAHSQIGRFTILDKSSGKPIAYATIKVINKPKGEIANENGEFFIDISSSDTLLITCVGFKARVVYGNQMESVIFLDPSVTRMKEVVIREKKFIHNTCTG